MAAISTFLGLQDALGDFLIATPGRLSTNAKKLLLNLSQRKILRDYDLAFGETTSTSVTVANTYSYAMPPLMSRLLALAYSSLSTPNVKVPLSQINTKPAFDKLYPDATVTGTPKNYLLWGRNIYFGPTPDAVYTTRFDYYGLPADLVNDNDTTDFLVHGWEAILFTAISEAEPYMGEDERYPMWKSKANEYADALQLEYRRAARKATVIQSSEPG